MLKNRERAQRDVKEQRKDANKERAQIDARAQIDLKNRKRKRTQINLKEQGKGTNRR